MGKYILSLDQGTTSSRAILFDHETNIIGTEQKETRQSYPYPGWVEQDALEIWANQLSVARRLIESTRINPCEISAIGITNQRETTVIWDRTTGMPIYPAIIWQDKRTSETCENLKRSGNANKVRELTGLVLDPYFSATKIAWILDIVDGARKRAEAGDLLFGTIDTWLAWNLSGGKLHITDPSNASRTLLFNIASGHWEKEMLDLFDIPAGILPSVRNSSEVFGITAVGVFAGAEIPLAGIAGDQQAALFGQSCFDTGTAKNTYGTGCFMLMNTGTKRFISKSGLLTTVAWRLNGKLEYALEGSVFVAGAAIKWLRDGLKLIESASETDKIALDAAENKGVYFVPAFAGLGAPYWDTEAKGIITGLTLGVDSRHMVRAALEAIAYQTRDVLVAMEKDSGIGLKLLNADGGASVNDFLMQFQADILGVNVLRPVMVETTALGAAFLAGIAAGFWKKDELPGKLKINKVFEPKMQAQQRDALYGGWLKAVECARNYRK